MWVSSLPPLDVERTGRGCRMRQTSITAPKALVARIQTCDKCTGPRYTVDLSSIRWSVRRGGHAVRMYCMYVILARPICLASQDQVVIGILRTCGGIGIANQHSSGHRARYRAEPILRRQAYVDPTFNESPLLLPPPDRATRSTRRNPRAQTRPTLGRLHMHNPHLDVRLD